MTDSSNPANRPVLGDANSPSDVESAKAASNFLRGSIDATMRDPEADHFGDDDKQLIKFHGIYQQDNRDARNAKKQAGLGKQKEYSFMVRIKAPGGVLTAEQYLALDAIAERYSYNTSLRLTTRQGIQFHGIVLGELRASIAAMNAALVSTLAACGDVSRNVMASPTPFRTPLAAELREDANLLAAELCPRTTAYHEIWVDGEPQRDLQPQEDHEPLYGKLYLPRKFKVGLALPEDNSVDLYSQDIGLLAVVEQGRVVGYNVLAGGGLGLTHLKAQTYARIGTPVGFVLREDVAAVSKAILTIHRDFGDRSNRKHARLKYVVEEWGTAAFREEVASRIGQWGDGAQLREWRATPAIGYADYLGTHEQGDGKLFYGLFIENGRIIDSESTRLRTAILRIVEQLRPEVIVTPNQNLLFTGLDSAGVATLESLLAEHGVRPNSTVSGVRRYSMACPALPTCGLALAEAERSLPGIIDRIEDYLEGLGLADEPLTIRMTGCPNGCARPYTADVAFVGRQPGKYDIFVGGRLAGDRLTDFYADRVPEAELLDALKPLFLAWHRQRQAEETLGDFYQRVYGSGEERRVLSGDKESPSRVRVESRS